MIDNYAIILGIMTGIIILMYWNINGKLNKIINYIESEEEE